MRGLIDRFRVAVRGWGASETITFAVLFLVLALGFGAGVYFGPAQQVGPALEDAGLTKQEYAVPEHLKDHEDARDGLERGVTLGAEPETMLPRPEGLPGIKNYEFIASPNYSSRMTCTPEAIVFHIAGSGPLEAMDNWFSQQKSEVSAHFGIGKDGTVHQYVDMSYAAWHAGPINQPNLKNPLIQKWVRMKAEDPYFSPNRCNIGIELMLAGPAEPLKKYPEMEKSLVALVTFIENVNGIPADTTHFIGHNEIDGVQRATDPICCYTTSYVVQLVGAPAQNCTPAGDPYYNPCLARWFWSDGWSFDPVMLVWFNPQGAQEWTACNGDKLRWNLAISAWMPPGSSFFLPSRGYWSLSGAC